MKKINKIFLTIIVILTAIFVSTKLVNVKADSGWDSSYDSGSSWSSGGSSGYSRDHSYRSSRSRSGSSSSSGSRSVCVTEECRRRNIITLIVFVLIIGGGSAFLFIKINESAEKERKKLLEKFNNVIPNFDVEEFTSKAYQIFYDVQMAWMNFDYVRLKELLTDELYNTYVMDLEALKLKNQKNVMTNFKLEDIMLAKLNLQNNEYIAVVEMRVTFIDYVENANNHEVLRGTKNKPVDNTYRIIFVKSKDEIKENICPSCGAKVEGNATGICEYCKAKLINETHDWVMSKKTKIK